MSEKTPNIYERLATVQKHLKAPKSQFNRFGNYPYRSAEDILEAAKPLLNDNKLVLILSDDMVQLQSTQDVQLVQVKDSKGQISDEIIGGDRFYVKATATVFDYTGSSITTTAFAREAQFKKGMDESQITGAASSYARKYALNGLFDIDDTKDADTDEHRNQRQSPERNTGKAQPTPISQQPRRPDRLNPQVNNPYTGPEIDLDESIKQDFLDAIASARTREEWTELLEAANSNEEPGIREAFWMILVSNAPTFAILKNIIGGAETRNAITRRVAEAARYRSVDAA